MSDRPHFDIVVHQKRKRFEPLRHACQRIGAEFVSLCGRLDTRLHGIHGRDRRTPYVCESYWIVDPNCEGCRRVMQGKSPLYFAARKVAVADTPTRTEGTR